MRVLFIVAPPRSCALGIGHALAQRATAKSRAGHCAGHLHLGHVAQGFDLSLLNSPLNLYSGTEALLRCCSQLAFGHADPESMQAIARHLDPGGEGKLDPSALKRFLQNQPWLLFDPSFSHSLSPELLEGWPWPMEETHLLVLWRNPVAFCRALADGIHALDLILQWMRYEPEQELPLSPLAMWWELTSHHQRLLAHPSWGHHGHALPVERFGERELAALSDLCPARQNGQSRLETLPELPEFLHDNPYSGDPSFHLEHLDRSLKVSRREMAPFAAEADQLEKACDLARSLGYELLD